MKAGRAVLAALLAGCAPPPPTASPTPPEAPAPDPPTPVERSARRLVVDPGHGGDDLGAIGPSGGREKDVALAMSLALAEALRARGFEVLLTRADDRGLPLGERAGLADASGAGALISVHANAAPDPGPHGIETYAADLTQVEADLRLVERENRMARFGAPERDGILAELRQAGTAARSLALATGVQASLVGSLRELYGRRAIVDRGAKLAPFWVLLDTEVPAILIEVGYMTHPDEELRLRTRAYQVHAAAAIAAAVDAWVQQEVAP